MCVCVSLSLSLSLPLPPSISLHLPIPLSLFPSLSQTLVHLMLSLSVLSAWLSLSLSLSLSLFSSSLHRLLSLFLTDCLYLSVCLSVCLFLSLSIIFPLHLPLTCILPAPPVSHFFHACYLCFHCIVPLFCCCMCMYGCTSLCLLLFDVLPYACNIIQHHYDNHLFCFILSFFQGGGGVNFFILF